MKTTVVAIVFGACASMVAGYFALGGAFSQHRTPDEIELVGNFEIVTRTIRHRTGWNTGDLGWTSFERYLLRHGGEPLTIEGRAGMYGQETVVYDSFNLILTFPAEEAAMVVNVGDPNNTSFYYLVREENGTLSVKYLCDDSGGISWLGWLDSPPPGRSTQLRDSVTRKHLEGGRYLLLGDWCVLDTESFQARRFTWSPEGSVNELKVPLGMSPDSRSFVRFGWTGESKPVLLVFDSIDDHSYAVPIHRSLQRFSVLEEIDEEWLAYYYRWTAGGDGAHSRLVVRRGVTPRPWKGILSVDPTGYREYRIEPVKAELRPVIVDILGKEMGAQPLAKARYVDVISLRIADQVVNVSFHDDHVGLWMERNGDTSLVEKIGKRLDAWLATGELDEYFLD